MRTRMFGQDIVGRGEIARHYFTLPLYSNWPRSTFLKRASLPLVTVSRRIAAESVACGILPPGLSHRPCLAIASIISWDRMGLPAFFKTVAAASKALMRLGFAPWLLLAALGFLSP